MPSILEQRAIHLVHLHQMRTEAGLLQCHQLDLLSQIEAQLRLVRALMINIDKIHRAQADLESGTTSEHDLGMVLAGLFTAVGALDVHLFEQHDAAKAMQDVVRGMLAHLRQLQFATRELKRLLDAAGAEPAQGLGGLG